MDDSTTTPLSADIQTLTNAHIAEYTALTTRLTYWIYLQWALFAAAGADLILIATLSTPYQAWLLLFILLLIAWGVLYTQDEILSTAVYIEGRLKPAIWTLPGFFGEHANALWRWEEFLIEWRGSGVGKFEQHLGLLPVFAAGILGMFLLLGFRLYDAVNNPNTLRIPARVIVWNSLWLVTSIYVLRLIIAKVKHNGKLRDQLNRLIAANAKRVPVARSGGV